VLLVVVFRSDRPRPTTLLPSRSNGKPEEATAVDKHLMMDMRMPETCWAVFKRQAIKLRERCIWLVDLFKYTSKNLRFGRITYHSFLHFECISSRSTLNVMSMSACSLLNLVPMSVQSVLDLVLVGTHSLLYLEKVPAHSMRSFVLVSAQNMLYREHLRWTSYHHCHHKTLIWTKVHLAIPCLRAHKHDSRDHPGGVARRSGAGDENVQ